MEDTGPLTKKRMETVDEEFLSAAFDYLERAKQSGQPFFVWLNTTRMHIHTHLKPESAGKTGLGLFPDGMVEHDGHVGRLLDKLDELGLAQDTIVIYTTDNGAMRNMWPDGGATPFRGEKDTNWEGAFRVPCLVRWPGVIKPGTIFNDVFSAEDWLPTLVSAAGDPDVKDKLRRGLTVGGTTFKVHLDGYDQTALLSGMGPSKREEFFYFGDDGELLAVRYGRMKLIFEEQRAKGFEVWSNPFTPLRAPLVIDLRADPFERSLDAIGYHSWLLDHSFAVVPAQQIVARYMETFREFPPRQRPASFSVDQVIEKMESQAEAPPSPAH